MSQTRINVIYENVNPTPVYDSPGPPRRVRILHTIKEEERPTSSTLSLPIDDFDSDPEPITTTTTNNVTRPIITTTTTDNTNNININTVSTNNYFRWCFYITVWLLFFVIESIILVVLYKST